MVNPRRNVTGGSWLRLLCWVKVLRAANQLVNVAKLLMLRQFCLCLLTAHALQASRFSDEPIQVLSDDRSKRKDQVSIPDLYSRKRKATLPPKIPSALEDQTIPSKGPSTHEGILVLPTLCYRLDVPRERGISCPFSSRVSLLLNWEYGCKMAQFIIFLPNQQFLWRGLGKEHGLHPRANYKGSPLTLFLFCVFFYLSDFLISFVACFLGGRGNQPHEACHRQLVGSGKEAANQPKECQGYC